MICEHCGTETEDCDTHGDVCPWRSDTVPAPPPCSGCDAPEAEHEVDDERYCDVCAAGLVLIAQRYLERHTWDHDRTLDVEQIGVTL